MATKIPLQRLLGMCDPRQSWPWLCIAPDESTLKHLLANAKHIVEPIAGEGSAELHLGRVRYLAEHGWNDPIEVDVGVPCLGYAGPSWPVLDGNHRVWAAAIRGDEFIAADITGQVDHAARLFGVSVFEITTDHQ